MEIARARQLEPEKLFLQFEESPQIESMIERGKLLGQAVLETKRRPTAQIAATHQRANGANPTQREAGVSIPREISVTGFDNLDLGRRLHPTLTTIDQNYAELMDRAGALLLEQIMLADAERGKPVDEHVKPSLVVGESTGPAPI